MIPKWLPGHRDWCDSPAQQRKLFQPLDRAGLETRQAEVGLGRLELIDAAQLFELGLEVISEDPTLLLCDDPHCLFCAEYQKILHE